MHPLAGDALFRMRLPHSEAAFYPVSTAAPIIHSVGRVLPDGTSSSPPISDRARPTRLFNPRLSYVVRWQGNHGPTVAVQVQSAFFFRLQGL